MKRQWESLEIIGSFMLIIAAFMLIQWLIGGRTFSPDLMILIGVCGLCSFGIRAYLVQKMPSKPRKCRNCNGQHIDVIRIRKKILPTFFCECGRCLHRSEYKHSRNGAIKDWNRG